MQRYLLFDAGCAVCNQLARAIEEAAGGKLEAVSLRERRAMKWLDQVYPAGWEHQPYLVTVEGKEVRAYAGVGMALRLGWLLGPRQGWRVWNLARRYGVVLPAGGEFSAERRGFLKRAGLFVAGLFFFPRLGSAGGPGQAQGRPRHPLAGIRIKTSRELEGEEKARAVQQALNSQDVRNVLADPAAVLDTDEAIAVTHELDTGNTLLIVGMPAEVDTLVYCELASPLIEGGARYESQAMLVVLKGTAVRLLSTSVNGRPLRFLAEQTGGAHVASDPCGGCISPINGPWDWECLNCTSTNWGCVLEHCSACAIPCSGGLTPPCLVCVVAFCNYWYCCGCCDSWESDCCSCGSPP